MKNKVKKILVVVLSVIVVFSYVSAICIVYIQKTFTSRFENIKETVKEVYIAQSGQMEITRLDVEDEQKVIEVLKGTTIKGTPQKIKNLCGDTVIERFILKLNNGSCVIIDNNNIDSDTSYLRFNFESYLFKTTSDKGDALSTLFRSIHDKMFGTNFLNK